MFGRGWKRATDLLRLNPAALILLVFTQATTAWIGFSVGGRAGVNLPQRTAAIAAPFVLLPLYFAWAFFSTIRQANAEQQGEIDQLKERIQELEDESQSDISIYLHPSYIFHHHPDHEIMHGYSVVIENVGPNFLTNCVLKLSTANVFNLELYDRSWLRDASATFDLRQQQVERMNILWVERENPTAPALPYYYSPDDDTRWVGSEGEIIPADQTYFLFCEVLSANTVPARLTLRVWNNGAGWRLKALKPGEKPSFDA
jgi:hypothetical protein